MQSWPVERQTLTLRVVKDKDGWANSLLKTSGLRIVRMPEGYKLTGIALELQTVLLLQRLADYGVRAKLQLSFWVYVLLDLFFVGIAVLVSFTVGFTLGRARREKEPFDSLKQWRKPWHSLGVRLEC